MLWILQSFTSILHIIHVGIYYLEFSYLDSFWGMILFSKVIHHLRVRHAWDGSIQPSRRMQSVVICYGYSKVPHYRSLKKCYYFIVVIVLKKKKKYFVTLFLVFYCGFFTFIFLLELLWYVFLWVESLFIYTLPSRPLQISLIKLHEIFSSI